MTINQENQTKKISLLDLRYKKLRKKIGDVEIYNPNMKWTWRFVNCPLRVYITIKEI